MDLTPRAARALARAAYLWAYPLVVNYGRLCAEAWDSSLRPEADRVGQWVERRMTPTAESDSEGSSETKVTWSVWLDLRGGAWQVTAPSTEVRWLRTMQTVDLWGSLVHIDWHSQPMRTLLLSAETADHMLAGIAQSGLIDQVVRCESGFCRTEISIRVSEPQEVDAAMASIRHRLGLESADPRRPHATSSLDPGLDWRPYRRNTETTRAFWATANYALSLVELHRDDSTLLERFADLGIAPGQPWDATMFPPDVIEAIDEGMDDAISELLRAATRSAHESTSDRSVSQIAAGQGYLARALSAVRYTHAIGHSGS